MSNSRQRFWELDFLRGLALVFMVVLHLWVDLFFVQDFPINFPLWYGWQRSTASIFLLLVGLSLTVSHARLTQSGRSATDGLKKHVRRGLTVFGWGLLATLASWLFLKEWYIRFGILHLIGASIILSFPFLKWRLGNLGFGSSLIALGIFLYHRRFPFPWLLWAGFTPENFFSVDYFPLLPWFGVVLWGVGLGNMLYAGGGRRFFLPDLSGSPWVRPLAFLGRHSLAVYLVHQPVILGLLSILGSIRWK